MKDKTVELLYWKKTASDSRDTASDVGSVTVPQRGAVQLARAMEQGYRFNEWPEGFRPGHGITVKYPSGKLREVHG